MPTWGDAIAGVINLVLKEQTDEILVNAMTGVTAEGDGEEVKADVNYGFTIGERGYFNVSGEFLDRGRTNRSGTWTGDIFPGISGTEATDAELASRGLTRDDFSMRTGQGAARVGAAFFNTQVPLNDQAEFYAFGGNIDPGGQKISFLRTRADQHRLAAFVPGPKVL